MALSDLAMVVETEPTDPMDIHFFLRDKEHNYLKPVEIVHEQINAEWNGYDRPGYENSDTEPELTMLPNGSIKFYLPALPVGGERTNMTLTIAYRNGAFIVAGFAYESEDFQQDNVASGCDYNVLTGKGASSKNSRTAVRGTEPCRSEAGRSPSRTGIPATPSLLATSERRPHTACITVSRPSRLT